MNAPTVVASLLCVILFIGHLGSSHAAPRSLDLSDNDNAITVNDVAKWLLTHLSDFKRERRGRIDGGFLSRHSAVRNYLNAYEASRQAADAFGPGRRK